MKRKKPFAATLASRKKLEAEGWTVTVVEQRIPHCFITRDAFGFADLLCCAPNRGILLVQVTGGKSTSNFHARVAKIKAEPRAGLWMASGGRIQVHSWEGEGNARECRVFEVLRANASAMSAATMTTELQTDVRGGCSVQRMVSRFPSPASDQSGRLWPDEKQVIARMLGGENLVANRNYIAAADTYAVSWYWEANDGKYPEQYDVPIMRLMGRQIIRPVTCAGGYTQMEFTSQAAKALKAANGEVSDSPAK